MKSLNIRLDIKEIIAPQAQLCEILPSSEVETQPEQLWSSHARYAIILVPRLGSPDDRFWLTLVRPSFVVHPPKVF